MRTVLLAGGLGTRLAEETDLTPKPMVEIGGSPILWHIMKIYASQGFTDFVVALGYRPEVVKNYFLNYYHLRNDITIDVGRGKVDVQGDGHDDWRVHLVDTGITTQTGGRIKRLEPWLRDSGTFMLTYGDGVADVRCRELVDFHRSHGKLATVTAVRPPARFGGLVFDGDRVTEFTEKPQIGEGWINGGFFVLEPAVLDYLVGDDTIWERDPLERLAEEGELMAYRHEGFWQPMDTLRDVRLLETLWQSGDVPWKVWK
jgi:glucose-1-phosphate cytidylyltransferase